MDTLVDSKVRLIMKEGREEGRKEGKEKKGKERGAYLGPELAGAFECRTQSAKRDSRAAAQRK